MGNCVEPSLLGSKDPNILLPHDIYCADCWCRDGKDDWIRMGYHLFHFLVKEKKQILKLAYMHLLVHNKLIKIGQAVETGKPGIEMRFGTSTSRFHWFLWPVPQLF